MLPTLKGVFPQSKIQHKRDFLLENKLYLKSLQRNSSRQQLEKAEEEKKLAELRRRQRHKSLDARTYLSRRRPSSGCSCSCDCLKTIQTVTCCRPGTAGTSESKKVETCSREVQTDDIQDEEFLHQALKRCSSTDLADGMSRRAKDDDMMEPTRDNDRDPNVPNFQFENLTIDTDRLPPTVSSTSLASKSSTTRRIHELGDRQDLRLPKYLEREKREKELQKQKELHRDHNCPPGYEPLTEEERQRALDTAQRKFQTLVSELNHMPMTTETLRIRQRKVEIERELVELEHDIRVFSKPRVYVKTNGML